jgi:hypothetical protein
VIALPAGPIWAIGGFVVGVVVVVWATEPLAARTTRRWPAALGLTLLGIVAISIGGELVAAGAELLIGSLGVSAAIVGMVVTPAAIELEEVIRQAVPA